MRNVPDYIRMLIYEHDYVTVPNLGAFIANYIPSSTNEISGSLMPPVKRVAFNEVLKQDDGLLATYISRRESITLDESKRKIQNFVTDIKDSLAVKKEYTFDKVGVFNLNQDKGLVFEPDRKNNFYSESYGFDSLFPSQSSVSLTHNSYEFAQKVYLSDDANQVLEENSTSNRWTYSLYALPVILLLGGLFYILFSNAPTKKSSLSSVLPIDYFESNENKSKKLNTEIIKPTFEKKAEISKPEEKLEEVTTESNSELKKVEDKKSEPLKVEPNKVEVSAKVLPTSETKKTYIIVCGMFKNKANVEKLVSLLQTNGLHPIVSNFNGLLKVSAGQADDMNEAKKISEKVKSLTGDKGVIQKQ